MEKTFFISNFGCRASQSEGASIHEELVKSSVTEASSPYSASVVVVNSCTVTNEADREVRQLIRRVASRNPAAQIIVTGCYAQRVPEELADLPHVRYVVGNSHKPVVGQLALNLFDEDFSSHGRAEVLCSSIFLEQELNGASYLGSAGRTRAVVKVQDGCNANCSFCIIPSVRGRSRSMPPHVVMQQVRDLVSRGYKEIVFSGIHLGSYGRDLSNTTGLYELLLQTLEISGLERLRLSSIEPLEVRHEIIDLVARHPLVAHHFHIPLQSGSSRVLRRMRRPYTPEYYADLLHRIRERMWDCALGADVMVGFPGETEEDFSATYELIKNSPLTYIHVFPYSPRPGTVAADLPHSVPDHVARFRAKVLRKLIGRKNEEFRLEMIGREIEVLTLEDGSAISGNFIRVKMPEASPLNRWIRVVVTSLDPNGVQASKMATAHETSWSCVNET